MFLVGEGAGGLPSKTRKYDIIVFFKVNVKQIWNGKRPTAGNFFGTGIRPFIFDLHTDNNKMGRNCWPVPQLSLLTSRTDKQH